MKQFMLIKMCLNETYSKDCIGKHDYKEVLYHHYFSNFILNMTLGMSKKTKN
jgi:hypothetical protein